jgi:hypothetical protein
MCGQRSPGFRLRRENRHFWNWLAPKRGREVPAGLPKSGRVFFSETDDGATLLGTIELDDDALVLSANSFGRAERGRELIEPVLGNLVGAPEIERQSITGTRVNAGGGDGHDYTVGSLATIPPERQREIILEYYDRHYRRILDEPIPVLGNISPRKAAASAEERGKAVDWIKSVENNHTRQALADPTLHYDCGWIWDELGLGSYRNA